MSEAEAIDRLVLRVQKCRDLASALTSRSAAEVTHEPTTGCMPAIQTVA